MPWFSGTKLEKDRLLNPIKLKENSMITTYQITRDPASNTIELVTLNDGEQVSRRNYHPSQRDELLANSNGAAQSIVNQAGWTDAYIASILTAERAAADLLLPDAIRADRDARIKAVAWRYERYARELRLGIPTTDNLSTLDNYIQALSDIPNQAGFPSSVTWPIL